MKNNKKLWIGIGCGVLVIALIVGIILMAGGNGKQPDPTNPTTEPTGTTAGGDVTNPSDVTDPTDGTEPTDGPIFDEPVIEDPVVDPDDPILSDPTEPSTPNGVIPDIPPAPGPNDDEDDDPTEGNGSAAPSTPTEDDDDPVVEDPKPTERPADTSYDFGGVTPSNITLDIWLSWDAKKSQAFRDTYSDQYLTWDLDTRWRWNCVISGLTDPYYKDGFYCSDEEDYNFTVAEWKEPCDYCGKSCCEDTLFRNDAGFSEVDPRRCSEYDIKKDPVEYCQDCGLKKGDEGCVKFMYDSNCGYCGEWVEAMTCHHCEKYHD